MNRKYSRKHRLLFYYFLMAGSLLIAQGDGGGPEFVFEEFELPRGLNGNHVQAIAQDSFGFMWFGSQSGLHRWDGYEMRTYLHDRTDSTSIASNYVEYLYVSKDGSLWIGTYGYGLDRFDYQRETFQHIDYVPKGKERADQRYVASITEDKNGQLWIATYDGVYRYDPETEYTRQYLHNPQDPSSLSYNVCRVVYVDGQGTLWIGTGMPWEDDKSGGLNRYRPETDDFERYLASAGEVTGLASNKITAIFEDSQQHLWIGTSGDGLHQLDRTTKRFTRIGGDLDEPYATEIANDVRHVRFIFEDRNQRLWIGCWQGGIKSFDLNNRATKTYYYEQDNPNGLPEHYPWTIFQSRDGTLWALTAGPNAGVSKLMESISRIHTGPNWPKNVTALGEARNGDLWVIDQAGRLYRYDPGTKEVDLVLKAGSVPAKIKQVVEDDAGWLWFKNYGQNGLLRYDPSSKVSVIYQNDFNDKKSVGPGRVSDIYLDQKGRIWSITNLGYLSCYQPETNDFRTYSMVKPPDRSFEYNYFTSITGAADGKLWVVGSGFARDDSPTVVLRFSPETETVDAEADVESFTKYFAGDERILSSASDQEGNLYLWSSDHFISFAPDGTEKVVAPSDRFGATDFNNLLVDQQQRVWLITDKIQLFDPGTEIYSVIASGSRYADWLDSRHSVFGMARGKIYTCVGEGLLEIDPAKVGGVPTAEPAVSMISEFAVLAADLDSTRDPITLPLHQTDEPIQLAHDQNAFRIRIGNPNYRNSGPSRQETQLGGHDNIWRAVSADGEVGYLGLPPGSYIFRVRTANDNGDWGPPKTLDIVVATPWWSTWWAYMAYALLASGLLTLIYRFQLSIRLDQAEAVRLRELDAVRSRLYTNITHEFRTPLTVILGMATQIKTNPDRWLVEGLTMIERNTQRLLGLVNQLLDLSKLDNNGTQMKTKHGDVVAYLRYVVDSVHALASTKNIGFHFYAEAPTVEMDFDPEKVQQVVINLLSNAIKFTPKRGNVYVTVRRLSAADPTNVITGTPALYVQVRDSGAGIAEDRLPYIFDRFYQADDSDTRRAEGTGIGLALVRELVGLMKGEISVKSQLSQGTEFVVILPAESHEGTPPLALKPIVLASSSAASTSIAPAAAPTHIDKDEKIPEVESGRPRVLLIEDNPDVVAYLASCLQDDYELLVGHDGQEGIEIATEQVPDLVVTDVMMPRQDGFSVCHALKQDTRTSHVPIIMLTAKADAQSKLTGLETGADAFLVKPFDQQELLLRIEKLIEGRTRLRAYYLGVAGAEKSTAREAPKEEDRQEHEFIRKLRTTVEEHIDDYDFTVEVFCHEVGMSSSQLHRKLTALTGLSPIRFIRFVRLSRAKILLGDPGLSVKVIAYETGFNDPSYFSRSFKKEFGMTPLEWREQRPERAGGGE